MINKQTKTKKWETNCKKFDKIKLHVVKEYEVILKLETIFERWDAYMRTKRLYII